MSYRTTVKIIKSEIDQISNAVKAKGAETLGGKESRAYACRKTKTEITIRLYVKFNILIMQKALT